MHEIRATIPQDRVSEAVLFSGSIQSNIASSFNRGETSNLDSITEHCSPAKNLTGEGDLCHLEKSFN
jgi:hypothetical protein